MSDALPPAYAPPAVPTQYRPIGKVRDPWMCFLLAIVTLGIYGFVWGYCAFNETRN